MEASDNWIEGGRGKVSTGSALAASTPKFKRCRVSIVRDFLPGCRRVTTSNYGLTRQNAIDHSSEGNQLKAEGWADGHMGMQTLM
ncbi:hypothetical protein J1N35_011638 [Gossypium stocksii]|uniref:Uncharacterized protein n=1 Tax=Gossypium stocksii TaxID=47602 RepID=A0A9D3W4F5_9ROSI|nr:hypothetical protein J1N35_011638 [Gossypium stocksii]